MKSWNTFKSEPQRTISTDSVSINETIYGEIQRDALAPHRPHDKLKQAAEVEYIESGTFQGGEEQVYNAGIERGEICLVIKKETLIAMQKEQDEAVAELKIKSECAVHYAIEASKFADQRDLAKKLNDNLTAEIDRLKPKVSLSGFKRKYVSNCCGASTDTEGAMETGICPHCREHCEFVDERGCGND
jgi:hypothetical protein